jgi:hypothetical protein
MWAVNASPGTAHAARTRNGSSGTPSADACSVSRIACAMYWKGSHWCAAASQSGSRSAG